MPLKLSNGLELTAEQESNLRKLALYHLRGIDCSPMAFHMGTFCETEEAREVEEPAHSECGSAGCLVGHGPLAGITALGNECWVDYSRRCFIPERPSENSDEWEWCFGGGWAETDNTPAGGAKRILWLLEFGLPSDWYDQKDGLAPLCYANWEPELPAEIVEQVPAATRTAVGV